MFLGRECWRNPEILLEMLGESDVESKASPKWLQPLIKVYIYLFGLPEVGTQLRLLYFRRLAKQFKDEPSLKTLLECYNFSVTTHRKFEAGMNQLFVCRKPAGN